MGAVSPGAHQAGSRWLAHEGNPSAGGMRGGRVAAILRNKRVSAESMMGPWREETRGEGHAGSHTVITDADRGTGDSR